MEEFKHSSPWPRIFVEDPSDIEVFSYECYYDMSRVIVSETPEIKIHTFGDHVPIKPFKMKSHEQFSELAINAIIKANEIAGKTFTSFADGAKYLGADIDCGSVNCVLLSAENQGSAKISMEILSVCGDYVVFRRTYYFPQIKKGEAYIVPEPEFLGVISERKMPNGEEWHGLAIINTKAVIKIIVEE